MEILEASRGVVGGRRLSDGLKWSMMIHNNEQVQQSLAVTSLSLRVTESPTPVQLSHQKGARTLSGKSSLIRGADFIRHHMNIPLLFQPRLFKRGVKAAVRNSRT